MTDAHEAAFDAVAASYEQHVTPMFRSTAQDLVALAAPAPGESVLDVGTGPGVAALLAAGHVGASGSVVGVDLSEAMLAIARENAAQQELAIDFRRADVEALDFSAKSFDVVLSSFGLGTTDPEKSLPAIRRVLKAGGRLALSQWGPTSRPTQALFDLLEKRRSTAASPRLEWLRGADLTARAWHQQYNTPAALTALLKAHGFQDVRAEVRAYTFSYDDSDTFLEMSLSFPLAQAEFAALSPGSQRMFRHEFNALMAPFRGPNRSISSEDSILFAVARG